MLIAIAVLLFCGEPECKEISACVGCSTHFLAPISGRSAPLMVSAMQQHEHCVGASHATFGELTLDVAALHGAVKRSAVDLLQTACRAQPRSADRSTTFPPSQMRCRWALSHALLFLCVSVGGQWWPLVCECSVNARSAANSTR
jgi:hypothetical protein